MTVYFDEYQKETRRTAGKFETSALELSNYAMGLAGESGEVVDYIKKVLFQGHKLDYDKLTNELGDVLWYLARMADFLGYDLSEISMRNIEKLKQRYPEGFKAENSINRVEE